MNICIPELKTIRHQENVFPLKKIVWIASSPELTGEATLLQQYLKQDSRIDAAILQAMGIGQGIGLAVDPDLDVTSNGENASVDEQFKIDVSPENITITGRTTAGVFLGIQMLRQYTAADKTEIPCGTWASDPQFSWRGTHLDVCRHFFEPDKIKKFLDLLALYGFNTFHWHLTEDQGWRIQIDSYPELTNTGAWRKEKDGSRYGGFYTKDEVREIVAYAAERHITVVPEIEMPGHAQAAAAAYPELLCTEEQVDVWNWWGVSEHVYCAGKESTFEFLEKVLEEVIELFPGEYFHVGGDECPKARWKECPACQKRIKDENLADEAELQSYFIKRMEKYLSSKGKKLIGWDEILEGGLAPGAAVMSWRGTEGGTKAASEGHKVVMTPEESCYFDHKYGDFKGALGPTHFNPPVLPLKKVYEFNPAAGISAENRKYIMGGQANIWTEAIDTWQRLEHMVFPRLAAMAESLWVSADDRNFEQFKKRLEKHRMIYEKLNIHFCDVAQVWGRDV